MAEPWATSAAGRAGFVLYDATSVSGSQFRNTEFFIIVKHHIQSIEVFFGLPAKDEPAATR